MKTLKHLSESLGYCGNSLHVYRVNRGLKKGNPIEVYEHFIREKKIQEDAQIGIQNLNYALCERGSKKAFAEFLVKKGICRSYHGFMMMILNSFKNTERLVAAKWTQRRLEVLEAYEEWRCLTSS